MRTLSGYGWGVSWVCVCVYGGRGGGLIPEENVEEINLNYKDEASLESGSGGAAEGSGGRGEAAITLVLFCIFGFLFFLSLSFFSPLILWE